MTIMFTRGRLLLACLILTTAAVLLLDNLSVAVEYDQLSTGALPQTILVAAATANTGGSLVRELSSQENSVRIKAGVRNPDDPRARALSALPRVAVVEVDFDDVATVEAAMEGVDRAFLVSTPFDHLLFERETDFLDLAQRAGIPVVRVSTYTGLMAAGTKCGYGRAHHGIEAFARAKNVPVVNLRPNWFFDNLLFSVVEIKSSGQVSYPTAGDTAKNAFIDPRDVASAAAKILLLPGEKLSKFVEEGTIEVCGPETINLAENVAVLSEAVGYDIRINKVPYEEWIEGLVSHGMPRVFARSYGLGVLLVAGDKDMDAGVRPNENSPLLEEVAGWKPKHDVNDWARSKKVLAAFAKHQTASDEF